MLSRPRLAGRVAYAGLALVLIMLTLSAVWATTVSQSLAENAKTNVGHSNLYAQALFYLARESALQSEYWQQPDPEVRTAYYQAAGQLTTALRTLIRVGEDDDKELARGLLAQHNRYLAGFKSFTTAVARGQRARSSYLDDSVLEPLFKRIEHTINTSANAEQANAMASLTALTHTSRLIQSGIIAVFALGLLLLVVFWLVLHAHRRRGDAALRGELARLESVALQDHVTGLGNHRAFQEELRRCIGETRRGGESVALALIDLDDFKVVNDQHGHAHGDRVLAELGALLRGGRAADRGFRLGGDEFALILPDTDEQAAALALERLRGDAEQRLYGATTSIGSAAARAEASDAETLREQADAALYEAKRRGRNTVVTFEEIRDSTAIVSAAKILAVRRLLAEHHVTVAFQPIWSIGAGSILAFEALTRPSPEYGLAGPLEAFDIAERIGRAHELDTICRQAILNRAHELPPEALLFLNVSPQSLDHDTLAGTTLVRAVQAAGLAPERVVLELTERSLARPAVVVREARWLRELGFRIALDDVGAGTAGLEMMRQLPVDYVKIDREVVSGALTNPTARSVLAAIIAFAREARTLVIAEGIESTAMLAMVQRTASPTPGVYAAQGYLLGRPSERLPSLADVAATTPLLLSSDADAEPEALAS